MSSNAVASRSLSLGGPRQRNRVGVGKRKADAFEQELRSLLPAYDGWIIGDDPATRSVLSAGKNGRLKVCVKWGAGTDNVDFQACDDLKIPVSNTPGMFGDEVADIALGYLIGLARQTFVIDRAIREGEWIKPTGVSLQNKVVGIVGYGNIGRALAARVAALGMKGKVFDPYVDPKFSLEVEIAEWPAELKS